MACVPLPWGFAAGLSWLWYPWWYSICCIWLSRKYLRDRFGHIAKNGAAVICYADMSNNRQREAFNGDEQHFLMYDIRNPSVENYISQVADCVHYVDLIHLRVHQVADSL